MALFDEYKSKENANGHVTNLLAQLRDYVNVGVNSTSVVDADSYWIDGYFEERPSLRSA
jgi:multidrug resistance efflux pump